MSESFDGVNWHQDLSDDAWTVGELDELGLLAYADVDGVEIDELGEGDQVADHGVNSAEEQV